MPKNILVIDDEISMVKLATEILKEGGYQVNAETNPVNGVKRVASSPPDLVLLDVRMPEMDGFEVCKSIRALPHGKDIPIVIVSVQSEEADVVAGLEVGADDYIYKPVRKRELLARVKALLRRKSAEPESTKFCLGPLVLDQSTYTATLSGKDLDLNPKEFKLLTLFMQREGQVLTRGVISEKVWGMEHIPTSRTIDTHVDFLRRKLGKFRSWIQTLKGVGYRLEVEE